MKYIVSIFFVAVISGCSSLPQKAKSINVGDTKEHVLSLMGSPDIHVTNRNIELLEFYGITAVGFCNYQQVWIKNSSVIKVYGYNNASIAGCEAGLKRADWDDVINEFGGEDAQLDTSTVSFGTDNNSENASILDELVKLSELYKSGALTDDEYQKAKKLILDGK